MTKSEDRCLSVGASFRISGFLIDSTFDIRHSASDGAIDFSGEPGDFMTMFASRQDAGQRLGHYLRDQGVRADLVLGLPRGGVVVAAEVARALHVPLDTLIVRKIGHPWHREFAVGALAEHGVVVLDEPVISRSPGIRADLEEVIEEEKARLQAYQSRFHPEGPPVLGGKADL